MDSQLQILEPPIQNGEINYAPVLFTTSDTRLAATLRVFGSQLYQSCPLEWVDIHKDRSAYLRYLEHPDDPANQPSPQVTFNFDGRTCPKQAVVKAFDRPLEELNAQLGKIMEDVPPALHKPLGDAIAGVISRCCHEALIHREFLVKQLKRMPRNAKFDQIKNGHRLVRLGKNCSAQTRHHFLSKLPP